MTTLPRTASDCVLIQGNGRIATHDAIKGLTELLGAKGTAAQKLSEIKSEIGVLHAKLDTGELFRCPTL